MAARRAWMIGVACAVSVIAAGCGSGRSEGGGATKTVQPAQAANARGSVTWCVVKDPTGAFSRVIKLHNRQNPKVKARLVELPESVDEARNQLVQRLRAKSSECDVLGLDVIWTAEFAAQNWVADVTPVIRQRQGDFIAATLKTAQLNGKYWGVPFNTNAGFLYYRTDKINRAPMTWQAVYADAKRSGGLAYQGAQYEGLTVDFLELLYSAGGRVLSPDGRQATIDSPQARQVLGFMVDGIRSGAVPRAVLTYKEEESRRAFQTGQVGVMRNWPYAYALAQASRVKGKFTVVPLPQFGARGKPASVLGGWNLGISAYSKNPGAALEFIDFVTGPGPQKTFMTKSSLPSTLTATYDDPAVQRAVPFALKLRQAVAQSEPRPVSPVYPLITEAIHKNIYAALGGQSSPQAALSSAQSQINQALKTF